MENKQTIWTVLYCIALIGLAIGLMVGTVTEYITPGESLIGALALCVGGLLNRKMEKDEPNEIVRKSARAFLEGYTKGYTAGRLSERNRTK